MLSTKDPTGPNTLPSDSVYHFLLAKVEDASVAEHPCSASALLDVVVAIAVKQASDAE